MSPRIAISSGHALHVRGARGSPVPPELDEVDEARRVVEGVAAKLRAAGVNEDRLRKERPTIDLTIPIEILLVCRCPSAIRWFIVSIVVNAIEGSVRWLASHIG